MRPAIESFAIAVRSSCIAAEPAHCWHENTAITFEDQIPTTYPRVCRSFGESCPTQRLIVPSDPVHSFITLRNSETET